jgi:hypothetical protein
VRNQHRVHEHAGDLPRHHVRRLEIVGAERADEVQAGDGVRCETVSTSIFREIREKYMDIM